MLGTQNWLLCFMCPNSAINVWHESRDLLCAIGIQNLKGQANKIITADGSALLLFEAMEGRRRGETHWRNSQDNEKMSCVMPVWKHFLIFLKCTTHQFSGGYFEVWKSSQPLHFYLKQKQLCDGIWLEPFPKSSIHSLNCDRIGIAACENGRFNFFKIKNIKIKQLFEFHLKSEKEKRKERKAGPIFLSVQGYIHEKWSFTLRAVLNATFCSYSREEWNFG